MVPDLYLEAFQIVLAAHNDAVAGSIFLIRDWQAMTTELEYFG